MKKNTVYSIFGIVAFVAADGLWDQRHTVLVSAETAMQATQVKGV
jgi:hypothetical protein